MDSEATGLTVAIFGPTGLAGTGVVHAWLGDPRVAEVRAVARRPMAIADPRLVEVPCDDFLDLDEIAGSLSGLDAVCFCLGISASQAESREEYRRITHDFAFAAGRAVLGASPQAHFHFVSGSGTSARSLMNWARVKAETERDLSALGLRGCVHWRPAMILPDVEPDRYAPMQRLAATLARPFQFLPRLAIANTAIGEAMLEATFEDRRDGVIENREMRALADRYRATRP